MAITRLVKHAWAQDIGNTATSQMWILEWKLSENRTNGTIKRMSFIFILCLNWDKFNEFFQQLYANLSLHYRFYVWMITNFLVFFWKFHLRWGKIEATWIHISDFWYTGKKRWFLGVNRFVYWRGRETPKLLLFLLL